MNKLTHLTAPAGVLLLSLVLPGGNALAVEPCPWQATQPAEVCQHWNQLQQQLKAAQSQEKTVRQALQSLEHSIQPAPNSAAQTRARALLDGALAGLDKQLQSLPGGAHLVVNHDYVLVTRANAYTATLQKAQLTFSDGRNRVDLSPLEVTIELLDANDAHVALKLPDSVPLFRGSQRMATLDIGSQKMTALWSDTIHAMKESHLKLQNVQFRDGQLQTRATLNDLISDQKLAVAPDGSWHGQQQLKLTGLHIDANGYAAQIGALTGDSDISGIHYDDFQAATGQRPRPAAEKAVATDKPAIPANEVSAVLKDVENFRGDATLHDVTSQRNGQSLVTLKRLELGSNLQRIDKKSTIGVHFGFNGLQSNLIPVVPNLSPNQANFHIAFANIDSEFLHNLIQMGFGTEKLPPKARIDYARKQLPALLTQSGAALQVTNTYVAAPAARVDLQVHATVAPEQPLGAVGDLLLTLTGMDKVKQMMGEGPNQSSPDAVKLLAAAMALSNRTVRDGKTIDTFDLQLTRDGKTLLNHKDVTALLPRPPAQKPQ